MSNHGMDSNVLARILELLPILAIIGSLIRWVFNLKDQVEAAHSRIDDLENYQQRFEDKIDKSILETNRRIDDCKDAILKSVNSVLQALSKS